MMDLEARRGPAAPSIRPGPGRIRGPDTRDEPMSNAGEIRWAEPEWARFEREHAGWLARVPPGPLYCLREAMIARLEGPGGVRPPVLDGPAAAAERSLLDLCRRQFAVGFEEGRPIPYPFLIPRPAPPSPEEFPDMGWSRAQWIGIERLVARGDLAHGRLKGYVGWLSSEPAFLEAVRSLERRWRDLPGGQRPAFPLGRPNPLPQPHPAEDVEPAPEATRAFAAELVAFLDRWGLTELASWDLPLPQGPLIAAPSPAVPSCGVRLFVPFFYPLAGDADLLGHLLDEQRAVAEAHGLDPGVAGLSHHKLYGQMLEVLHLERAARARYARPRPPRGLVDALVGAIAEALGISAERVRRLRKMIATCRAGRRGAVKALRPRRR